MNSLRNTIKRFLFAVSFICVLSALWGQTPLPTHTWRGDGTGSDGTAWNEDTNWVGSIPPPPNTKVHIRIPSSSSLYPKLTEDVQLASGSTITVQNRAELDLREFRFIKVSASPPLIPDNADITIIVEGTLKLDGKSDQKTLFTDDIITLRDNSTVQYNPGSLTDPIWQGEYKGNLIINRTVPCPPNSTVKAAGTIRINKGGVVFADNGNLTIEAGQIQIGSGPDGSGGVVAKAGSLTLEGDTYLSGNSAMLYAGAGAGVTVKGNVFAAIEKLYVPSSLTCTENFVLYKGTVRFDWKTIPNYPSPSPPPVGSGITAQKDLVLLGRRYNIKDTETGIGNLFAYNNARRTGAAPSLTELFNRTFPDGTSAPSSGFTGKFKLTGQLNSKILKAGKNFYANGIDLEADAGWTLDIPDNDNATASFAEAYNVKVKHCTVTGGAFVAAAEGCIDQSGNSGWDFGRPTITEAYTVSDDTVYVKFNKKIENSNNEIQKAITQIKFANGQQAFAEVYTVNPPTPPATERTLAHVGNETHTSLNDMDEFFLRTTGERWNTDATGTSAGDADSTDRSGTKRTVKVDLTIPKALDGLYASLRDEHKNRIKHYFSTDSTDTGTDAAGTANGKRYGKVEDHCPPVLIGVYTGQEQHFQNPANQPHYDAHNFIEFRYSEPVDIGSATADLDSAQNVAVTDTLGKFLTAADTTNPPASGYALRIAGLADIPTGRVTAHFRGTPPPGAQPHALYRKFPDAAASVPALSPTETDHKCRVRISVAGLTDGTVSRGGHTVKNWVGYITAAEQCAGTVKPLDGVTDRSASHNPLDTTSTAPTVTVTKPSAINKVYGNWDTFAPVFAKFSKESGDWTNTSNKKKEIAAFSTSSSLADKIEFHFFDNTPDYTSAAKWWKSAQAGATNPGWYGVTDAYDTYGGSRFTGTNRTTGGIRACSLPTPAEVSDCFKFTEPAIQTALNRFHNPQGVYQKAENGSLFGQPSGTWSNFDNLYLQLKIASSSSSFPVQTGFKVEYIAYDSSHPNGGFITDLAGNLMLSSSDNETAIASPPTIALTVAPVGSKKMFILFSSRIETTREDLRNIPSNLRLIGGSALQIDTSKPAVVRTDTENATGIIVSLNQPVQYNDVTTPMQVEITGSPIHIKSRGTDGLPAFAGHKHVLSDFAVNVVRPLFAFDEKMLNDGSKGFLTKGLYGGESQAVRLFDGSGIPGNTVSAQSDITLNVAVDVPSDMPKHGKFKLYITNAPDPASVSTEFNRTTGLQSRIWFPSHIMDLPSTAVPHVSAISPQSNGNSAEIPSNSVAASPPQNPYVFKLRNDPDISRSAPDFLNYAAGTTASFLFPMVNSMGTHITIDHDADGSDSIPLYALRLKDPNDPASIDLWSLNIGAIKEQAGGVSILNNVINTSTGESTLIEIKTGSRGSLNVVVMSLDGDVIKVLHSGRTEAGTHLFKWNGTNKRGEEVARGLYFIRVTAPGIDETRKVMAVRE